MAITVPEPESTQALNPSDSLAHQTGTPPLLVHPSLDIPFMGTPLFGHPFSGFRAGPSQEKWDCSLVAPSMIDTTSGPMSIPKRSRLGKNAALHMMMKTHPNWYQRLGPAQTYKGRNLPVPPPVQPRLLLIQMMVLWWEPQGVLRIRTVRVMPTIVGPNLTQVHPERMWLTFWWSQPLENASCVQTQMR